MENCILIDGATFCEEVIFSTGESLALALVTFCAFAWFVFWSDVITNTRSPWVAVSIAVFIPTLIFGLLFLLT